MIDIVQVYALFDDAHKDLKKVAEEPDYRAEKWIKVIKSKNFYNYVRESVGATTRRQVERMFTRKVDGSASGKWIDAKKWRNYERGCCVPTTKTVDAAERIAKQSFKQELTLVLWSVLDMSLPIEYRTCQLIRRLPQEDRRLARICDKLLHAKGERTAAIRQVCATLTAKPSLDRLAIVTLFLRKSNEIYKCDSCCIFSIAAVKMLLLLGAELSKRRIAADLYWFYSEHIFDLIPQGILDNERTLMIGAELLHHLAFVTNTNDATSAVEDNERIKRMNRFLDGEHGSAFLHTFLPYFQLSMYKSDDDNGQEDLSQDNQELFDEDCDIDLERDGLKLLVQIFVSNKTPRILHPSYFDPDLNFKFFSLAVCRKSAATRGDVQAFNAKFSQSPTNTVPWLRLKY